MLFAFVFFYKESVLKSPPRRTGIIYSISINFSREDTPDLIVIEERGT